MREIKFRVFDTVNEVMVYNPEYFIEMPEYEKENERNNQPYKFYETWRDYEDGIWKPCKVMQFTGKKDKNGKDIWEGDYNQHGEVVIWCDECSAWQFGLYDFPTKDLIFCHTCDGNFLFHDGMSDIEIIGNIYEQPDFEG